MAAAFVAQPTPQNELPECCRTGFLFAGTPTGTETKYGEIDTYVAAGADKGSKKVIVIFTDAFGWKFSNTRIVADAFAQGTGFNVYVPDLMAGTAVDFVEVSKAADPRTIWGPWLQANGDSKAIPLVDAFLAALKEAEQPAKVAAIGYCWGARYATIAAIGGKVDLLAMAHPTRVEVPAQFEQVSVPTLFLCAEEDSQFPYPTAVDQTKAVYEKSGVAHEFHVYLGTKHGFAIRGDENNAVHAKAKTDAAAAAIKFFQSRL